MNVKKRYTGPMGVLAAGLVLAACGGGASDKPQTASASASAGGADSALPQGSEQVDLGPTIDIDNPYFPMRPGNKWVYAEADTAGKRERLVVPTRSRRSPTESRLA